MNQKCNKTFMKIVSLVALLALASGQAAFGNDAILDLLVKKGVITQREANDIREQADAEMAKAVEVANKVKTASWIESMTWLGDLRLRADYISFEDDPDFAATDDRLRFQYRARFGFETKFPDWATVGFRLASTSDDNPVSTNQTLGDTFSRKGIGFDLAYATLTPPMLDWVSVTGGKMKNPIWQTGLASPMVYDNDVTTEGVGEQLFYKFGDKRQFRVFGNFGQWVLDEVSFDVKDIYMYEFQAGIEATLGPVRATLSPGYYTTHNLGTMAAHSSDDLPSGTPQSASPNRGNAATDGFYLDDFHIASVRGELAWTINERGTWGTPNVLTFSGEYLKNLNNAFDDVAVDPGQTTGWSAQIAFGDDKKRGQWKLSYQYKHLEADATWDAITDSDWGNGGTDRKGHAIRAAYNIRDWWQFSITAFATEKISDRPNTGNNTRGIAGEDHFRVLVDNVVKF